MACSEEEQSHGEEANDPAPKDEHGFLNPDDVTEKGPRSPPDRHQRKAKECRAAQKPQCVGLVRLLRYNQVLAVVSREILQLSFSQTGFLIEEL